jgi:hypothetical protein
MWKTHFDEEDMIGCIALNFEITRYKILLDIHYLSVRFWRDTASQTLHPYKITKVTRVSKIRGMSKSG